MAEAPGVYVAPEIEHSDWDATEERLELFTITTPDATTTVPAERVAAHIGMPHNVAMVRRWLIDAGRKDL